MRRFTSILLQALVCAAPVAAQAQSFGTTTGFPIGEKSRVHTGLDMTVGFDSNSKRYNNANAPVDGKLSDWKGILRPSLGVIVPGSSVQFNLLGGVSIMRYFGTGSEPADTTFGGDVTGKLVLGSKDSFIGFSIENQLVRTPVFMDTPGTVVSDERRFPLWHNRGQALFTLRPGGRALEFDLGYGLLIDGYDVQPTSTLPTGVTHSGIFEARWKFFPKTAFLFHADVGYFSRSNDEANSTFSAIPLHIYLGALGQVTTKLNAEITVGYGDTLSDGGGNFTTRGPIGNLILTYAFSADTSLSLGYRRKVMPEVIVNSYSADAPFVKFSMGLFGRLKLSLYGEYQFRKYGRIAADSSGALATPDRTNVQVAIGDARVEYWFFSWLNAGLVYRLQLQKPEQAGQIATNVFFQDFSRHQVFFNVGLRY